MVNYYVMYNLYLIILVKMTWEKR